MHKSIATFPPWIGEALLAKGEGAEARQAEWEQIPHAAGPASTAGHGLGGQGAPGAPCVQMHLGPGFAEVGMTHMLRMWRGKQSQHRAW